MTHINGTAQGHPVDKNGEAFSHETILAAAGENFDQSTPEINEAARSIDLALNPPPPDRALARDVIGEFTTDYGVHGIVEYDGAQWFVNGQQADLMNPIHNQFIREAMAGEDRSGTRSADSIAADARAAADRAERARQFDLSFANDIASAERLREFNIAKAAAAMAEGNTERALQAQGLIEQITSRIETNKLRREQMMVETAAEIGRLAQNPADVGQLAGFLRAGLTQRDLLETGQNAITDESLAPIQSLLQSQRNLANAPQQQIPTADSLTQEFNFFDFLQQAVGEGTLPGGEVDAADPANDATGVITPTIGQMPLVVENDPLTMQPSFPEDVVKLLGAGGTIDEGDVAVVGERGPELAVNNPTGGTDIIPFDRIQGMQDGGTIGAPRNFFGAPVGSPSFVQEFFAALNPFAGGTAPGQTTQPAPATSNANNGPVTTQDARDFIQQSGQDALRLGGFNDISDVSTIKVAAPGTSKFLRDVSASTSAALGLGPQSLFWEELLRLIPRGVQSQLRRRTA